MPNPVTHHRRRTGFTLIELLVVIAIIAILAAVMFPVFAKARQRAVQSKCISHLRQIGVGLIQCANDNDNRLPWAWRVHHLSDANQQRYSIVTALDPYPNRGCWMVYDSGFFPVDGDVRRRTCSHLSRETARRPHEEPLDPRVQLQWVTPI